MIIIPKTRVRLFSGIPIDPTYQNVLKFNSTEEQTEYFNGRTIVKEFTDFNYMDETRELRVRANMETLYNVNYIAYQNATFGDKWFYAFVDHMEYYSPETTAIFFTMDIYASWQFNLNFGKCFVIREHTNDDTIGLNTLPENVELGAYITTEKTSILSSTLLVYMIATDTDNVETSGDWNNANIVSGYPIGCKFKQYGTINNETMGLLQFDINAFATAGKLDAIVAVFCAPSFTPPIIGGSLNVNTLPCAERTLSFSPKNNKLFTYPYVTCVEYANGQANSLRYELFSGTPALKLMSTFGVNAQASVFPMNYEGISENTMYELTLSSWPLIPFTGNYYQNWIANNKATLISNVVGGVVSIGAGLVGAAASGGIGAGSAANAVASGVNLVGNTVAQLHNANIVPDKLQGSANANDVNSIAGLSGFYTFCRTIRPEYGKVIDDFFSMFGYKTNKLKYPNITGRSKWNFVQTAEPVIYGNCPKDVIETMGYALKKGVTFWHTGEFEYGDLNNPII